MARKARVRGPGYKQLQAMTASEMSKLSELELRDAYQTMKKVISSRARTFEKHGKAEAVPARFRSLESSRGMSGSEVLQNVREMVAWARSDHRSTYSSYMNIQDRTRQRLQDALPDIDLSSMEKYDKFGKFMGDMQDRFGEMFNKISNDVRDIYREAERLNVDPHMFMKNYDYWADHIEDLKNADPIQRRSNRELRPSDYARKLKLEKIGGGQRR